MATIKNKQFKVAYDKEGDVLDISIGTPQSALSVEISDDVFVRLDKKTNQVLGFMILNFQRHTEPNRSGIASIPVAGNFVLVR